MLSKIRKIFTRKSASTDILRTHILVLILPIITSIAIQLAVVALMHREIRNVGELVAENARINFDNLIENVEKLSKQLSINDNIAMMYSNSIRTNNYNLKDAIHTLHYICESMDDIDDAFVFNNYADVAITTSGRGNGASVVENYYQNTEMDYNRWIKDMKELRQPNVRVVYKKQTKDVAYVEYLYPMAGDSIERYDVNSRDFPAVLVVRINYDKLALSEKTRSKNPHTILFGIDGRGNIIGDNDSANTENSDMILKKCAGKSDFSFKYGGQMYICSRSQKTDWIYVTAVPILEYNKISYVVTVIVFLSSFAVFLLGLKLILNFIRTTYGGIFKMIDGWSGEADASRGGIESLNEYFDRLLEERDMFVKKAGKYDAAEYYIALFKLFSGNRLGKNDPYLAKISNYMSSDKLVALCCKMEDCSQLYIGSKDEQLNNDEKEKDALYIVENVIKELLEKDYAVSSAFIGSNLVFLVGNGNSNVKAFENDLYSALEKYMGFLDAKFAIKAVMSAGKTVRTYNDVYESYLEALEATRYSFILGHSRVIVAEKFDNRNDSYKITKEQRERLGVNLRCGNLVEVIDIIDEMYAYNIENSSLSYEMIKCFLVDVCGMFADMLTDVSSLEKRILECTKIEDTRRIFHECAEKICFTESKKEDSNTRALVSKIESYIGKYYTDDNINVFAVASEFGFSREYISRIFKKYTNTTILDTIHNKRMTLAQQLLADGRNVNDVAHQVGYTNVNVFIRRFKQHTKMTPKEYATKCLAVDLGNDKEK